jgi:DNA-directed RNA polymerase specialized sigma24 family protein
MRPPKGKPDSKEVILTPSNQAVLDAISALSAPIPEFVAERYFEGRTIEEISVLRGVSRYVVRRHLTSGLHQLKKHFNEPYRVQLEEIRLAAFEKLDLRLEGLKLKNGLVN